jgi:hypothetical protein
MTCRPIAHTDGDDFPRLIDEFIPGVAAMVEDILEGFEDPVRQPIVAHELPDVLLRVQFRAFRRQPDQRDIRRDVQAAREMPAGLIEEKRRVRAGRDLRGDFGQVEVHRFGVAPGHDERRALAVPGTDRPEDIG